MKWQLSGAPGPSGTRTNWGEQATNLAVPGAFLGNALASVPDCDFMPTGDQPLHNILADVILGLPGCLAPGHVVLDAEEVAKIRAAIAAFNHIIADEARRHGAALVDVHRRLQAARKRGIVVGDRRLTTEFLGGLFSLDGVHPTTTGYAILANDFITALNRRFAAGIPLVDVEQVLRDDPLALQIGGSGPRGLVGPTGSATPRCRSDARDRHGSS